MWDTHLSGAQLPVPCVGCVEVIARQAQSTQVQGVRHLRKKEAVEDSVSIPYLALQPLPIQAF